jgi:uracil-DNA glycosylase
LTTGRFPGSRDSAFVDRCRAFFVLQLKLQRPRVIVALGAYVPAFLAPLSHELTAWTTGHSFGELDKQDLALVRSATFRSAEHTCAIVALTHPSLRLANVGRRRWREATGHQAELLLIRAALQLTS